MNRKTVFRNLAIVAGILLVIYAFSYFGNDTRGLEDRRHIGRAEPARTTENVTEGADRRP